MPKAAQHHALARQWQVLRLLPTKPPGITSRELVEKLEREGFTVTKRTVERDLAELSTIFGIACNDKGMPYGWHWMKGEYADLPGLSVSDAVSLRLVEDLLRPLLPSAMLESLEARFGQAKAKLAELSADNPNAKWADKVRYVSPSMPLIPPKVDSGVLNEVHDALLIERQIEVEYKKASGEQKAYRLHPLGLVQRGQITYLVATAFDYQDERLYALHRIISVKTLDEPARGAEKFTVGDYVQSGALEFGDSQKIILRMRVTHALADILAETPLSKNQQLVPEAQGYIAIVEVHDSWQLEWWLLSQGDAVEVIDPPHLRYRLMLRINAMCLAYQIDEDGHVGANHEQR
jgi:predicted DNA-binding transcriptional regulator YafY